MSLLGLQLHPLDLAWPVRQNHEEGFGFFAGSLKASIRKLDQGGFRYSW